MRLYLIVFSLLFSFVSCLDNQEPRLSVVFDSQGHRGARGLYPENTVPAFYEALEQRMTTLELDLAVSKDSIIIVSHEPWFNPSICLIEQLELEEKQSLFSLDYDFISTVDCGSKGNTDFPSQSSIAVAKPSLREVITKCDQYADTIGRNRPKFNIEIKTIPGKEGIYTPEYEVFVDLLVELLYQQNVVERTMIQSFNIRPLQIIHEKYPEIRLSYLHSTSSDFEAQIEALGFNPDVYSPHHLTLRPRTISQLHAKGIQVIPWTVNDVTRMTQLMTWGVDGIITDYPHKLNSILP